MVGTTRPEPEEAKLVRSATTELARAPSLGASNGAAMAMPAGMVAMAGAGSGAAAWVVRRWVLPRSAPHPRRLR